MLAGAATALAAAEWLRGGGPAWATVSAAAGIVTALLVAVRAPRRATHGLIAAGALGLGSITVLTVRAMNRVDCCWGAVREERIERASKTLRATLIGAMTDAQDLADAAIAAAGAPRDAAFARLAEAVARGAPGIERGVALLAADGEPIAWAGRHRLAPVLDTAELRADITPFYVTLAASRQAAGVTAVGTLLLDAAPAIPDRGGAMAVGFERAHGVALRFYAPRAAPRDPDVFDFCPRNCDSSQTLFSVKPVPPTSQQAMEDLRAAGHRYAGAVLVVLLILLVIAAPQGVWRWSVLGVAAWALARAPLVAALTAGGDPTPTLAQPMLGFFSTSAAALTILATAGLLAASALWRRGVRRRWWTMVAVCGLVVVAPYLVRYFGRGIRPPAAGVSMGLWLTWEIALAATAMALILLAAALVRGPEEPTRTPWIVPAAGTWAVLAAVVGLWLWQPNNAWPEWYTFVWLPALVGAIVPARRRAALVAIATVAGTAAALVTWGAAVEGRLALAQRDVARLGTVDDPRVADGLMALAALADTQSAPRTASELYALWHESSLAAAGYPAALALWTARGDLEAHLQLAALDLPDPLIAALVRSSVTASSPRVERLERIPGVHDLLVTPLPSGERLTVAVGPLSLLVPADRVARFLRGEGRVEPPYALSLSFPSSTASATERFAWRRDGWSARGERRFDFSDGVRHVHALVDLRSPWALLVRGALVVLVNLALLALLMATSRFLVQGPWPSPPPIARLLRESYRLRLAAVLVGFFVIPVFGFALWSFAHLGEEAARAGDLLITQTLRDATGSVEQVPFDRPLAVEPAVVDLGARLDADLWAYRGGTLAGASAPVLSQLGLLDVFLSPDIFQRLALRDELETAANGAAAGRLVRVGYRVVVAGPPAGQVILAVPQLLDDAKVRNQEQDLTLALMLATLAGLFAATYLAGVVARRLERPVAVLREAALAVGRGAAPPAFPEAPPLEFAPVMSAFSRMAVDVRTSREALEEARRRTAQVLATVATGVIAVDETLRVTLANPRAAELLGMPIAPGEMLSRETADEWRPVWEAVARFVAAREDRIAEREFEIGSRRVRVQLALIGAAPEGCVIALDDVTALARAARVLAWGEMARQVAHEIKNPLTPVRLGIQHLLRARESGSRDTDFDATLADTARRILTEIDRLDAIARAFSRFGTPPVESVPLEPVNLFTVATEVVQLYSLGGEFASTRFTVAGAPGVPARARTDEVKEVLVNLLENSRQAGARRVRVAVENGGRRLRVADDGRGVPMELLPRVFEPAFSTTSSGSGLGLAIARRLVEGWGGTIEMESPQEGGATVTVTFQGA